MTKAVDNSNKSDARINFTAQFNALPLEQEYRQKFLKDDKRQLAFTMIVYIFPTLIFLYSDYKLFQGSNIFFHLLAVRLSQISLSLIFLLLLPRVKSHRVFDMMALFWWISIICVILYVNYSRPPQYHHNAFVDLLVLFSIYVLVQNPLVTQITPALLFSSGNLFHIITTKIDMSPIGFYVVWVSFILGNILGIYMSYRLHSSKRLHYAALEDEKRLRRELEKAIAEIKVLRGIIPICSNCKKIRDDHGFWEQVDVYISQHSNVGFSHSLCPDCLKILYPDLYSPRDYY